MHENSNTCTLYNGKIVEIQSILTCPKCGHKKTEIMPTEACVYFYECEQCKTILKPLKTDCCVYCSFGTVRCPSMQAGENCC
ncbi:GDCCVxC domain-containing (seleno)protein [Arachidicoccus sp.]|uniref:GDCCVxC domain-containing (seleno)protein n=1 Tax=Arachidicoccus sp. TaxID=1872624 RepID=UPI003D24287C